MVYLDENLSYRDKGSAELCDKQAADEEITQSSSEELQIRHTAQSACVCVHTKQTDMYKHTARMTAVLPHTYQSDGHENEKQRQVMEDKHAVLTEERLHGLKRVAAVGPGLTSDPLSMVVAQIHGVDVVDHIGSSEQSKPIDQPVTV